MDFTQVKSDSLGKWPGIYTQFGIDVGDGKHRACPFCGGKDRFRFDDKGGRGTAICGQCGAGDGFYWIQKILNIDFKMACEEVAKIVGTITPSKYQPEKGLAQSGIRPAAQAYRAVHTAVRIELLLPHLLIWVSL